MNSKVLFFCKFPPPYTGQTIGTNVVLDVIKETSKVLTINTSFPELKPSGYGFDLIKYYYLYLPHLIKKLYELKQVVKSNEIRTLYIVSSPSFLGLLRDVVSIFISRKHAHKIVAHIRNGNYAERNSFLKRKLFDYLKGRVDVFIFLSEGLKKKVSPVLSNHELIVVPNSIDQEVICDSREIEDKILAKRDKDNLQILFLSNMLPTKGYWELLYALERLRNSGHKAVANFIGGWKNMSEKKRFENYVLNQGLGDSVDIVGSITDRSVIKKYYLDADIFVLPTYYPNEAQPRSIIEAMNAACPVISTDHASIHEYVEDNVNGFLVEKKNSEQIVNSIIKLSDFENWKGKALNARNTYLNRFSAQIINEKLNEVILN